MLDNTLYHELRDNSIVMESFREMAISQEGRDRIKYVEIVTEAFANPTKQAGLLNKLFNEVQKVEEIDFGKIPDSKGDLTKYAYYHQMYQCIEVLNEIVEGSTNYNITAMNKLHKILLDARADYTFGYRTNNFIIINTYNLMVTCLYEMINVCIVDATEYLRAKLSMQVNVPTTRQIRWVVNTANQYIKMYENGQWATLMKGFRSAGSSTVVANEADTSFGAKLEIRGDLTKNAKDALNKLPNIKEVLGSLSEKVKELPVFVKISGGIVALIGLFILMRKAIYYFINCAGKLSDRLKNMATILRANIAAESNPNAVDRQKALLKMMENTSEVIDYKILKSEKAAATDMIKADKAEFNPQEINNISGSDFEL